MTNLFLFGDKAEYPRNAQLIELGRQRHGGDTYVIAPATNSSFVRKNIFVLTRLIAARFRVRDVSTIYVGFYGYIIIYFAKLLYPFKPIYFDAYISNYEILQDEPEKWQLLGKWLGNAMTAVMQGGVNRVLYYWDYVALRLAKQVMIDTYTHRAYLLDTFNLSPEKVDVLYVLPDLRSFERRAEGGAKDKFRVFFHGSNQVIHNGDLIVQAAKQLERRGDIVFVMVGPFETILEKYAPTRNIIAHQWIPYDELSTHIHECDLCLGGHFTSIPRAQRVIAGKTFQYLATGTPTLVQDNAANRELLQQDIFEFDELDLIFCQIKTSQDLANAIQEFYEQYHKS